MSLPSVHSLFRQFVQRPALMLAATATLGVSIGAATAISSAVKAVLLGPLPIDQPERLAVLWQTDLKKGVQTIELSSREYEAWRSHLTSFSGMAAVTAANIRNTLTGNPEPEQVESAIISRTTFTSSACARDSGATSARRMRATRLARPYWSAKDCGRDDTAATRRSSGDDHRRQDAGHRRWRDARRHTASPRRPVPERDRARARRAGSRRAKLVGRLQAGASLDAARSEVDLVAPRLTAVRPNADVAGGRLEPFTDQIYGQVRPALQLLTAAVACLLLIACANVANLLLARASTASGAATRAALGPRRAGSGGCWWGEHCARPGRRPLRRVTGDLGDRGIRAHSGGRARRRAAVDRWSGPRRGDHDLDPRGARLRRGACRDRRAHRSR
jgi:putative ABC transport system permease protein